MLYVWHFLYYRIKQQSFWSRTLLVVETLIVLLSWFAPEIANVGEEQNKDGI